MSESYQALGKFYDRLIDFPYDKMFSLATECHTKGKALDLFCGTGRFSILLAQAGFNVEASDLSERMLQEGMLNASKNGVKIVFKRENALSFAYSSNYDLVTAVSDGVNYLTEKELPVLFSRVYDSLKVGGRFVFDMSSPYKIKEILGNEFYYEDYDDLTYFWKNTYRTGDRSVKIELTFFEKNVDGSYTRSDEEQRQYSHEIENVEQYLKSVGFVVIRITDERLRRPKSNSERVFFVAQK